MKYLIVVCSVVIFGLAVLCQTSFSAEIHDAAQAGDQTHLQELLAAAPNLINAVDAAGRTPLHWACRGVHFEMVKFLVERGADVNARDVNGAVPLHSVVTRNHLDAVRLLLDQGALVDAQIQTDLSTSLHFAVQNDDLSIASLLIEAGASLGIKNRFEQTPLHLAVGRGQAPIVRMLVANPAALDPASLDLPDFDGNTALHLACAECGTPMAGLLLAAGADINTRNSMGETPLNIASQSGCDEIRTLLVDRGADQTPPVFPNLSGPYLGQEPPGMVPKIFAKGIVSTGKGMHSNIVFSPNLDEVVWNRFDTLCFMTQEDGLWSPPRKMTVAPGYSVDAPFFSPDGDRLYFVSGQRDSSGMNADEDIWYLDRQGDGWSEPRPFDSVVNSTPIHWQVSMDNRGNVYIGAGSIVCVNFENGRYTESEKLPEMINQVPDSIRHAGEIAPFISPEGDYLIFNRVGPPTWSMDFLISFRGVDGGWMEPKELMEPLRGNGMIGRVSPDGKYLFFLSDRPGSARERSVYWVDAKILDALR